MLTLFDAYDSTLNLNISFGLKFGILLNGAVGANASSLLTKLESHLKDMFKDLTGVSEFDGNHTPDGEEPEGRLHGSFELVAHLGDLFVRRFAGAGDEAGNALREMVCKVIN